MISNINFFVNLVANKDLDYPVVIQHFYVLIQLIDNLPYFCV